MTSSSVTRVKVGLCLPTMEGLETNRQALALYEGAGLDSAWVVDHLLGLMHPDLWPEYPASKMVRDPDAWLDPFCVATDLAERTRLELGSAIVDITRRGSADLVRSLLTVHQACPQGFIFGVGAGIALNQVPFGYDFDRRVSRFERTMIEIRALLDTGRMPDGVGRHGLPLESPFARPRIWAAAHGPRMRRIAGRYADGWITSNVTPEQFIQHREEVFTAAKAADRPTPTCAYLPMTFLASSKAAAAEALERAPVAKLLAMFAPASTWARYGVEHPHGPDALGTADALPHAIDSAHLRELAPKIPFELFDELVITGSAAEVTDRLRPYVEAGCQHIIIPDLTALVVPPEGTSLLDEYARIRVELNRAYSGAITA